MMYKAKAAVCSNIRTKHSTQNEGHIEFLNVKPWWYVKKPLGVKTLIIQIPSLSFKFGVDFITLARPVVTDFEFKRFLGVQNSAAI